MAADAGARAAAEGKIRVGGLPHAWREARWVEVLRLRPVARVALNEPRAQHQDGARGNVIPANLVRPGCEASEPAHGRVEPHAFLHHGPREVEPSEIIHPWQRTIAQDSGCLLAHGVADLRMAREKVPSPSQRCRRGLVPGEEHRYH